MLKNTYWRLLSLFGWNVTHTGFVQPIPPQAPPSVPPAASSDDAAGPEMEISREDEKTVTAVPDQDRENEPPLNEAFQQSQSDVAAARERRRQEILSIARGDGQPKSKDRGWER